MTTVLEYYVFDGQRWLAASEQSWTSDFTEAASFNDAKLAQDIGEREAKFERAIYVMACLGWQS